MVDVAGSVIPVMSHGMFAVGCSFRLSRAYSQGSPGLAKTYRDGPHPDNAKIEVRSAHTVLG